MSYNRNKYKIILFKNGERLKSFFSSNNKKSILTKYNKLIGMIKTLINQVNINHPTKTHKYQSKKIRKERKSSKKMMIILDN